MRIVTFNLHAGIDGWGRPTDVLATVAALAPDVLVCPETWRGEDDHYARLAHDLAMTGAFAPLATGERMVATRGRRTWQPFHAHLTGDHGLYFAEHRDLSRAQLARRASHGRLEPGQWGLTLLTRLPVEEIRVVPLTRLPREKVSRALIAARLVDGDRSFWFVAVHGAHLSHGSFLQYREVNRWIAGLDPATPVLIAGDFNCWRPLLRLLLPGWRTLVRARTWPARRPHSQIDHVLGRGPWRANGGGTRDGGSDHLALYCDLAID